MFKTKKFVPLMFLSLVALASCGSDPVHMPADYKDKLFENIPDGEEVVQNNKEDYYNAVLSSSSIHERTVKDILYKISTIAHDYLPTNNTYEQIKNVKDVTAVLKDNNDNYSVADGIGVQLYTEDTNLAARAKKSMLSASTTSSYTKDNLFIEQKYVNNLLNDGKIPSNFKNEATDGIMVTQPMTYEDVFKSDYSNYMSNELYGDLRINYLTSEYIYTMSYSSIGNTNARKIQLISLTDRSDEPGDAKQLLDAYVRDYIDHNYGERYTTANGFSTDFNAETFFVDKDFYTLSRLWKGITQSVADYVAKGRYNQKGAKVVLTADEEAWLRANNLLDGEFSVDDEGKVTNTLHSRTLAGKVYSDMQKLEDGNEDYKKIDSSLESSYTGSYAYTTDIGVRKAIDAIAQNDLVTSGIHLKSESLSGVNDDLKNRIFSSKISTSKSVVDEMKEKPGTRSDLTLYGKDGFRYVTRASSLNTGDVSDSIIHYDTSSSTYSLVRILDAVDTNALNVNNTNSIYDTKEKQEQIAREVAYAMSTTGSYRSDSSIYWLSRLDFTYSDDDFLSYMKSNYNDIFKTENPYSDRDTYPLITLPDTAAGTEQKA